MNNGQNFTVKDTTLIRYQGTASHVTVPEGITVIDPHAFSGCSARSIALPGSLTAIKDHAFRQCPNLSKLTFPGRTLSLSLSAFVGCPALADSEGFVIVARILFGYYGPGGDVAVPEGVTAIGEWVFSGCETLSTLVLPDSVTVIGNNAISNCYNLRSLSLPAGVTDIGENGIYCCPKLTELTLPQGNIRLGDRVFYGCDGLADRDGFVIVNQRLYDYCGSGGDVVIPEGVTVIADDAFRNQSGPVTVTIPDSVTDIGASAFCECDRLKQVRLPQGLARLRPYTFARCTSLTRIRVPGSVRAIEEYAFHQCDALKSLTLSTGVTSIGKSAFDDCGNLPELLLPPTVTEIGENAFALCRKLTCVTIPDSVTSLGEFAFAHCTALTEVTLPRGLTHIPRFLFWQCHGLSRLCIPSGVTQIGTCAFGGCSQITLLSLPESIHSLGGQFFGGEEVSVLCAPGISPAELDNTLRIPAALGFLCFPHRYEDAQRIANYQKYIPRQRKDIFKALIALDLVEGVQQLLSLLRVRADCFEEEYLQPAQEAGATQCTAFLMNWKHDHLSSLGPERKALRELRKDPLNATDLRKLWAYEKLPDGTVRITGYKGSDTDLVIPHRIGRSPVTEIAALAFHPDSGKTRQRKERLSRLRSVTLPGGIRAIGEGAFPDTVTLHVVPGSYGQTYAQRHTLAHISHE